VYAGWTRSLPNLQRAFQAYLSVRSRIKLAAGIGRLLASSALDALHIPPPLRVSPKLHANRAAVLRQVLNYLPGIARKALAAGLDP